MLCTFQSEALTFNLYRVGWLSTRALLQQCPVNTPPPPKLPNLLYRGATWDIKSDYEEDDDYDNDDDAWFKCVVLSI